MYTKERLKLNIKFSEKEFLFRFLMCDLIIKYLLQSLMGWSLFGHELIWDLMILIKFCCLQDPMGDKLLS